MAGPWTEVTRGVFALVTAHPLLLISLLIFVEELGVPSPIPGDLMMVYAGVQAAEGHYPLWLLLLLEEAATVAGSSGLYFICRRAGRPLVERYGRFIHVHRETLDQAAGQIERSGGRAIVAGRLIPGLRILTPIAAGTLGVSYRKFLPAVALGGFIYLGVLTMAGRILGQTALVVLGRIIGVATALVSLIVLVLLVVVVRWVKRDILPVPVGGWEKLSFVGATFIAGVVAGFAALLAANSAVEVITLTLHLLGYSAFGIGLVVGRAREVSSGLDLLLGWPVFLAASGVLGVLAGHVGRREHRRFTAILLVTVIPFGFTLGFLIPFAQARHPGFAVESGGILIAIEVIRWAAFGLALLDLWPLAVDRPAAREAAVRAERPVPTAGEEGDTRADQV